MAAQVDSNEPGCIAGVMSADDNSPKTDVVGGAGDGQSSCDWLVDSYGMKMIGGEDLSQGVEADDERGESSSDEDDDWQEVEGQCG